MGYRFILAAAVTGLVLLLVACWPQGEEGVQLSRPENSADRDITWPTSWQTEPPPDLQVPTGQPGTQASSNLDGSDPNSLYQIVRSEARDALWASRSEAAIMQGLRNVPDIGGGRPLEIQCATTICEVSGVAAAEARMEALPPIWQELKRAGESEILADQGLIPVATQFGSGRSLHAFVLYFRRVGPLKAPG